MQGAPGGDDRRRESGDGFYELAEGEGRRQAFVADDVGQQGVERHLHDGVADAEQRERYEDQRQVVVNERNNQRDGGEHQAENHGFASADLVHQHAGRHRADKKPEENH